LQVCCYGRLPDRRARSAIWWTLRFTTEVIAIRYDTYSNLVAMGVIRAPRIASPFPGQFVPDPR